MENGERQSFVMYASFLEAAEGLGAEAFKECVLKLRDYALYGVDVYSKDPAVNIILIMAKPNLNAASARYQRCIENGNKGKGFGSKGGRPRKGESREDYLERKRLSETPRKPLDVNDNEKEDKKENDNNHEELIQSPAAMEPTRGSGNYIGFSSFSLDDFYKETPSRDDMSLILSQLSGMSERDLERRYETDMDKIIQARVNNGRHKHESLLATEAAIICKHMDNLPTLSDAREWVVRDLNAAIQEMHKSRQRIDLNENDQPF